MSCTISQGVVLCQTGTAAATALAILAVVTLFTLLSAFYLRGEMSGRKRAFREIDRMFALSRKAENQPSNVDWGEVYRERYGDPNGYTPDPVDDDGTKRARHGRGPLGLE